MDDLRDKVYAVGHYSQVAGFWVLLGVVVFLVVHGELHPPPLFDPNPPCHLVPAVKP